MDSERNKIIIITAPSGAGKTTIVKHLLSTFSELSFSVSATTRKARANEIDGTDYFFLSSEEFQKRINEKAFAEYEMVYENLYYGTLNSELELIWSQKNTPLIDIDVKGAQRLKDNFGPKALSLFIEPPSMDILKERLIKRGTETDDMLQKRLARVEEELSFKERSDYSIINDTLEHAFKECEQYIRSFLNI